MSRCCRNGAWTPICCANRCLDRPRLCRARTRAWLSLAHSGVQHCLLLWVAHVYTAPTPTPHRPARNLTLRPAPCSLRHAPPSPSPRATQHSWRLSPPPAPRRYARSGRTPSCAARQASWVPLRQRSRRRWACPAPACTRNPSPSKRHVARALRSLCNCRLGSCTIELAECAGAACFTVRLTACCVAAVGRAAVSTHDGHMMST